MIDNDGQWCRQWHYVHNDVVNTNDVDNINSSVDNGGLMTTLMDCNDILNLDWYWFFKGEFLEWEGLKGRGLKGDLAWTVMDCNGL